MKIADDVLAALSRTETNGNTLVLVDQLDRQLYTRVNKVLEAAGGKWNRKAKSHVFDGDAAERMDQILLTGEIVIPKDDFDYFPTPMAVVDRLMELADVRPGMTVLEPSAGRGAIVRACLDAGAIVDCCEIMESNVEELHKMAVRYAVKSDFLTVPPLQVYDRVVMNPPFSKQADIKHVTHALQFLKPHGRLVSVMSAGVVYRDNRLTRDFRGLISDIEPLPDGSFRESGTMVRTVIVTI